MGDSDTGMRERGGFDYPPPPTTPTLSESSCIYVSGVAPPLLLGDRPLLTVGVLGIAQKPSGGVEFFN
jgi:hypothetical protein